MNNNILSGFNSEDFERLLTFAESNAPEDISHLNYCLQSFSANDEACLLSTQVILNTHPFYKCKTPQQSFFFYKVVEKFLRNHYASHPDLGLHCKMCQFLAELFHLQTNNTAQQQHCALYLRNKAAQLFALTLAVDYDPWLQASIGIDFNIVAKLHEWLANACQNANGNLEKESCYDFYLRILHSLHKDVIVSEGSKHDSSPLSIRLKDRLREGDVNVILTTCSAILDYCVHHNRESALCQLCCKVLSAYADWVDIQLITHSTLIHNLMSLFISRQNNHIQLGHGKVMHYFRALCKKGMPAQEKVALCQYLWDQVMQQLGSGSGRSPSTTAAAAAAAAGEGLAVDYSHLHGIIQQFSNYDDFWLAFAKLCNSMMTQLLLAYKDLWRESPELSLQALHCAEMVLDASCPIVATMEKDIAEELLESWREYISLLKSIALSTSSNVETAAAAATNSSTSGNSRKSRGLMNCFISAETNLSELIGSTRSGRVAALLSIVTQKLTYHQDYDFNHEGEKEEEFQEFRKDLLSVLTNVIQLDVGMVLDLLSVLLKKLLNENPSGSTFYDIEVILLVFYHLGEAIPRLTCAQLFNLNVFPYANKMCDIMQSLCLNPISRIPLKEVKLLYFETVVRYEAFFTADRLSCLSAVLEAMLDDRGIRNADRRVRLRSAYLFSRLIRSHKQDIKPFTSNILQGISDLLILPKPDCLKHLEAAGGGGGSGSDFQPAAAEEQTQQAFIYETASQLIFSCFSDSPKECAQHLSQLHQQVIHSVPELVSVWLYHRTANGSQQAFWQREEKCNECAKWLKSATEMLSRTSRVFSIQAGSGGGGGGAGEVGKRLMFVPSTGDSSSSSAAAAASTGVQGQWKTPHTTGCAQIFLISLDVFSKAWRQLLDNSGPSLWRLDGAIFLSGLRSFIHRLVAVCRPPTANHSDEELDGQWLLTMLPGILPLLWPPADVIALSMADSKEQTNGREKCVSSSSPSHLECVRTVREVVPLINQVILQFKSHAMTLISSFLQSLLDSIEVSLEMAEDTVTLPTGDPELPEERKLLRRSLGTLLSHVTTHMPTVFQSLEPGRFQKQVYNLLRHLTQSLALSDAMTLKQLLLTLRQMVLAWYAEEAFRHNFVYAHLSESLFTMPLNEGFRLEDGQFSLVLNEIAVTWRVLWEKMSEEFLWYLKSSMFPRLNVPDVIGDEFIRHLKNAEETNFPAYLKKFYSTFKKA